MTTIALLSERNFAPARFIAVKRIIRITATTSPEPLSRPALASDLVDHVEVHVHPADAVDVGDRGEHFDGRDEDGLQPRRPSGGEAGDRAVGVIRESAPAPATGYAAPSSA